jgi:hypothetical protein
MSQYKPRQFFSWLPTRSAPLHVDPANQQRDCRRFLARCDLSHIRMRYVVLLRQFSLEASPNVHAHSPEGYLRNDQCLTDRVYGLALSNRVQNLDLKRFFKRDKPVYQTSFGLPNTFSERPTKRLRITGFIKTSGGSFAPGTHPDRREWVGLINALIGSKIARTFFYSA